MKLLALDAVPDLPFALWAEWYQHEAVEPFEDRRSEMLAFLTCKVLSGVMHMQLDPTEEMFRVSAPLDGGESAMGSRKEPAAPKSLLNVRANFARVGIDTYVEG